MAEHVEKNTTHCLKILVVDDDDLNRRMMRLLLVRDGHDVQLVADGVEALEAVKTQKFDVVFMDLQMPIMDGFEASRRIREWENGNFHTYIVALTASYLPEEGQRLFDAGVDNYIAKPFQVDHIQRLLGLIARSEHVGPLENKSTPEGGPVPEIILDVQKGLQQMGGDVRTYRELLTDFIQGLSGRIKGLEQLLDDQDLEALGRAAHNLKGVSLVLGAIQLSECAGKLDKQSNEGYTDQNQDLILDLKRAEANLQKLANDFLNKQGKVVASA